MDGHPYRLATHTPPIGGTTPSRHDRSAPPVSMHCLPGSRRTRQRWYHPR